MPRLPPSSVESQETPAYRLTFPPIPASTLARTFSTLAQLPALHTPLTTPVIHMLPSVTPTPNGQGGPLPHPYPVRGTPSLPAATPAAKPAAALVGAQPNVKTNNPAAYLPPGLEEVDVSLAAIPQDDAEGEF